MGIGFVTGGVEGGVTFGTWGFGVRLDVGVGSRIYVGVSVSVAVDRKAGGAVIVATQR